MVSVLIELMHQSLLGYNALCIQEYRLVDHSISLVPGPFLPSVYICT